MEKSSKLKYLTCLSIVVLLLATTGCTCPSCDSDSEYNPKSKTEEPSKNNLTEILEQSSFPPKKDITLPVKPTKLEAQATIEGVDRNNNQVRDDLEHVVYQILNFTQETELTAEYNQVLEVIKYIQPSQDNTQIIDQHDFYCKYVALPAVVKNNLSMGFLQNMVTDTEEREKAFFERLKRSEFSTDAEVCDVQP